MRILSLRQAGSLVFALGILAGAENAFSQDIYLPPGHSGTGGQMSIAYLSTSVFGLGLDYGYSHRGMVDVSAGIAVTRSGIGEARAGGISVAIYPIQMLAEHEPVGILLSGSLGLQNNRSVSEPSGGGHPSIRHHRLLVLVGYGIGAFLRPTFARSGPDVTIAATYRASSLESPFPEFPKRFTGSAYSVELTIGHQHAGGRYSYMRPGISSIDGHNFFTFAIGTSDSFSGG